MNYLMAFPQCLKLILLNYGFPQHNPYLHKTLSRAGVWNVIMELTEYRIYEQLYFSPNCTFLLEPIGLVL